MEAIKQTNKVQKATAASHSTGKSAMSGSFAPERASAVPSYIQTKLSINKPGDKYEREADSVADKVMRMSSAEPKQSSFSGEKSQGIQRQSQGGNLTVNNPNVAIKAFSPTMITRKFNQGQGGEKNIQRKENKPDSEHKNHENTQLLETELKGTKGSGQPLSPQTNAFMSRAMGADFSQVRIHTDAKAVAMNKAVHAHAFTHGKDIYFNTGKYDPESASGKHLLAHELTHVVQQGGGASKIQKHDESDKIQRKTKRSISTDKAYQGALSKVKNTAQQAKKHEPVGKKVKDAQMAAKPPANEKASKAKDKQVATMAQQEPATFNEAKFKEALKAKIEALRLNSLQEAADFKKNNGAAAVKGDMSSQVSNEKNTASAGINNSTKEEPNASKEVGKEVGIEPKQANGVPAPTISGQDVAPKPVDAQEISLQKESNSLDTQMSEAKVTDTQLSKSNEPKFNNALTNKKTAQQDALQRPQQFKKDEKGIIAQAQIVASGASKTHLSTIVGSQKKQMGNVLTKQQLAKAKDEKDRAKVSADIEQKFATTKADVEGILSKLDTDVNAIFDKGIAEATKQFHQYVDDEVLKFKLDRYLSRVGGLILWGYDLLKGPPDEINDIYRKGKNKYVQVMDVVITAVAKLVVTQLNSAKKRIATGKAEIKSYVDALPKNLKSIGDEASKNIQSQFNELESSVNNKQNELVDSLAAKYKAGIDNIDAEIEKMKEANKGLIDQAIGAIKDVINTIIEFKNMLLDVLARAASAIDLIIADPIGFLGNLVAGVKLGVQNFVSNILTHLKAGLMGWLFGTLASAGIDVPKSFDFKGILTLILQVLGLTYANIRSRAVNIVGEKVVSGLEKAAEIFIIIKNEGISGLWRFIKEKVEDLKETVISSIKEFVVTKIITAGVTWLISMLNPASAFVKACKMIYDVIMFFVNRGKQIMALVNAVIDSVTAIAKGNISVAANFVENALAKAIPVAIGFLASLLGLDGISEKIKAIIQKIQAPINKAIDWVINKAVSLVKGVGKLFGVGKDKSPEEDKKDKEERLEKGLTAGQSAVNKFAGKAVGKVVLNPLLSVIKLRYQMESLEVVKNGDTWVIEGVVNPKGRKNSNAKYSEKEFPDDSTLQSDEKPITGHRNRDTYGYRNTLKKNNANSIPVLLKSLMNKGKITQAQKSSIDYLKSDEAEYKCKVSNKVIKHKDVVLGHKKGASEHWNDKGHKQIKADNIAWNRNPDNFHGVEDRNASDKSGAGSDRYNIPSSKEKSHPMWWNTKHELYPKK
jgi:Domain of unknown function (DUF4157)